eukprot:1209118-Prorocentrum_lima.AAC.1
MAYPSPCAPGELDTSTTPMPHPPSASASLRQQTENVPLPPSASFQQQPETFDLHAPLVPGTVYYTE